MNQSLYVIRTTSGAIVSGPGLHGEETILTYTTIAAAREAASYVKTPTEIVEFIPYKVVGK